MHVLTIINFIKFLKKESQLKSLFSCLHYYKGAIAEKSAIELRNVFLLVVNITVT
jgi:hypothetical protein